MSGLKDIYWMASPLAIDQRDDMLEKGIKGVKLSKRVARFVDPKNEIHVFRKIEHWTIEIDGKCYELSPDTKKKLNLIRRTTDMIKPHCIDATKWREIRESKEIKPEKRKIGQTRKTHEEILAEVDYLWANFNGDWYGFFTQNCQNFAHMLFERVVIEEHDAEKGFWEKIPDPIGYRLAEGGQVVLAGKAIRGTRATYLAAATAKAAPIAEAGQGVTTAGTMGATATSTTAASGGTVAATGTTASTAGSTAAVGSTTASTATGTAAAGGSTAGTTAAGGGAATSGHVGLGAKAAALMHGSHAAAIGSGMMKAGAVAAYVHPVTGLAMTGGLAYLVIRGKRGKGWNKKNKKPEDMDGFDLLVGEEEAFEEAENPDNDADLNDSDQEIDDELAEDLRLGLITTEPGTMTEEHEAVPAVQDTRRAQTTI